MSYVIVSYVCSKYVEDLVVYVVNKTDKGLHWYPLTSGRPPLVFIIESDAIEWLHKSGNVDCKIISFDDFSVLSTMSI